MQEFDFIKKATLNGKTSTNDTVNSSNNGPLRVTKLFKIGSKYLKGVVKNSVGDIFEGEIVDGLAQGPGTLKYTSGNSFRGNFKDDLKHGAAEEVLANGITIVSNYLNGKKHGNFQT